MNKIRACLLPGVITLIISCLFMPSILASESSKTLSSNGRITYRPANVSWQGACISNLAWEPFGSATFEEQIDLMIGASAVRIYLNYWAWVHDPVDNSLGLPYKLFLDEVAGWCYARGIRVIWCPHVFSRWGGNWGFDAKEEFLLTGRIGMPNCNNNSENWSGNWETVQTLYWSNYTQWIVEIASRPAFQHVTDAIEILNEPPGAEDWETHGSSQQALENRYIDFVRLAIDTVRNTTSPDSRFIVEGCPFWRPVIFLEKPLNRSDIVYSMHWYCHTVDPYANNWQETLVARAYSEGRYDEAKARLLGIFNDGYDGCGALFKLQNAGLPVIFGEVGTDPYNCTYWARYMQDFYDICREKNVGFLQHGFFSTPSQVPDPIAYWCYCYGMLNDDLRSLNEVGQLWHNNVGYRS